MEVVVVPVIASVETLQIIVGRMVLAHIQAQTATIKNADIKMRLLSKTKWVGAQDFAKKNDCKLQESRLI